MKGNNSLTLNQATMMEALQFWLDSQFVTAPRVTNVAANSSASSTFEVSLEDRVEVEKP